MSAHSTTVISATHHHHSAHRTLPYRRIQPRLFSFASGTVWQELLLSMASNNTGGSSNNSPPPPMPPLIPYQLATVSTSSSGATPRTSSPLPSTSAQSPTVATPSTPSSSSSNTASSSTSGLGATASGSSGLTATGRSKRQELSFAERIQVIMARKSGKSMRQLAVQFGCGKTQILNILGQREAYLKEWDEKQAESNPHISARKRRSRRTGNEETNQRVWDWYTEQRRCNVRVTGPMLQKEARSIARSLGIANFAASNGWLDSFRRLHNIGPQSRIHLQQQQQLAQQRASAAALQKPTSSEETVRSQLNTSGASYSTDPEPSFLRPGSDCNTTLSPLPGPSSSYPGYQHPYPQQQLQFHPPSQPPDLVPLNVHEVNQHDCGPGANNNHSPRHQSGTHGDLKHFANMAVAFRQHQHQPADGHTSRDNRSSQELAAEALARMQLQSSFSSDENRSRSNLQQELQLEVLDEGHFADRFASGTRINSAASNFSPPANDPAAASGNSHSVSDTRNKPLPSRSSGGFLSPSSGSSSAPSVNVGFGAVCPGGTSLFRPEWQQQVRRSIIIQMPGGNNQSPAVHQPQRRSVLVSTAQAAAAAAAAAASAQPSSSSTDVPTTTSFERSHEGSSNNSQLVVAQQSLLPPISPQSDTFTLLRTAIRENGLSSFEYTDEHGSSWLEIRPPSSHAFRVPFFGYRTHLLRLIIDRNYSYWLEALGQCVRSGTLRSLTTGSTDFSLIQPLFSLLLGSATVCQGRGSVLKRVHEFHPKFAQEQALAGCNYFTLPDYRYRAYDCLRLVDSSTGQTRCHACQSAPPALEPISPTEALSIPSTASSEPLNLSLQRSPTFLALGEGASVFSPPAQRLMFTEPYQLNVSSSDPELDLPSSSGATDYMRLKEDEEDEEEEEEEEVKADGLNNRDRDRSQSCCGEWDPRPSSTMEPRRARSDSPQLAESEDSATYELDFHATWIKQEDIDSQNGNSN